MAEVQGAAVAQPRLLMVLLLILATAAVALSAIGIHGLISSSVTERTRETTLIELFVWGVGPTDLATYSAVAALFIAVAVIASVLPALRILRLDPAKTLRAE